MKLTLELEVTSNPKGIEPAVFVASARMALIKLFEQLYKADVKVRGT